MTAVAAVALLLATAVPASAVTPTDGGPFAAMWVVTINDGPGDQYDAHVDGDDVSYTSDDTVRYYSFETGADAVISNPADTSEQLSDVNNGIVAFSQFFEPTFESYVRLFDIESGQVSVAGGLAGEQQNEPAIGANAVATTDWLAGEVYVARFGGPVTRLTNDDGYDFQPEVSPSGDLVVWSSCPGNFLSLCDVQQATWTGSSWQVATLTSTDDGEFAPATDGDVVAYESRRGGESHIYWQPAGGGTEHMIDVPGSQVGPSVADGIISFQSTSAATPFAHDIYLYEIASNRLFQLTSTPDSEQLSDITVLPDGRVRVVWNTGGTARDVYGATIELPPTGPNYAFAGFQSPVDARPTLNSVKAGAAVPVKFSLGADEGLAIFAADYPRSQLIPCDSTADVDPIEQTVSAGGSSLSYDPVTGTYTYVWKTDKAWKGTCRQLVLGFGDGSTARANFKFQ